MASPGDLRFPSIDGLRAFEAAARLGSYERAAGELHVTASAVGKRVAAVEELLGQPLFTRQGKALALTTGGREYLEQVRSALALLAAMPQHRRAAQRRRRLRVCAPPTFARLILVPELASFTQAHDDVELEIVLSIPFHDVNPGTADVEVRASDAHAEGDVLLDDVVLPMAAPALLARLPPLRAPADLRHAPLLRTHDRHHQHRRPARAWPGEAARAAHVLRLRRQRQLDREHLPRQRGRLPEDQAAPARGGEHGEPQHWRRRWSASGR
jgi:LysR family transcriptional regulator, glycine cleavage system transcriptional activator